MALVLGVALVGSGSTAAPATGTVRGRTDALAVDPAAADPRADDRPEARHPDVRHDPDHRPARWYRPRRGRRSHLGNNIGQQQPAQGRRGTPGGGHGKARHRRSSSRSTRKVARSVTCRSRHRRCRPGRWASTVGRPSRGPTERRRARRWSGLQRRLRPGRRRAPPHQLVHVYRGQDVLEVPDEGPSRLANAFAAGPRVRRASSPTMKHFPGIGSRRAEHGPVRGDDGRLEGALSRPGHIPYQEAIAAPYPADHAVERDLHRVRREQRRGLVARNLRSACCAISLASHGVTITDSLSGTARRPRHPDRGVSPCGRHSPGRT